MPFNTPVTNPEKGPKTTCSTSPSNVVGTTILPNATAANNAIVIAPLAPILKIHFFKFCAFNHTIKKQRNENPTANNPILRFLAIVMGTSWIFS